MQPYFFKCFFLLKKRLVEGMTKKIVDNFRNDVRLPSEFVDEEIEEEWEWDDDDF